MVRKLFYGVRGDAKDDEEACQCHSKCICDSHMAEIMVSQIGHYPLAPILSKVTCSTLHPGIVLVCSVTNNDGDENDVNIQVYYISCLFILCNWQSN